MRSSGRQIFDVYRLKFLSSARALAWCPYPRISTRALRFQNRTGSVDGPWNSGPNKEVAHVGATCHTTQRGCVTITTTLSFLLDLRIRPEKDLLLLSLISNPGSRHFRESAALRYPHPFSNFANWGILQVLPGGGADPPTLIQSYSRLGLLLCTGISRQRHIFPRILSGLPTY